MEKLKRIGMFFVHWTAAFICCFLMLFVTRFFTNSFDVAAAISVPTDKLVEVAVLFAITSLFIAGNSKKYSG